MLFPLRQRGSGVEIVTIEVDGGQLDDEILSLSISMLQKKWSKLGWDRVLTQIALRLFTISYARKSSGDCLEIFNVEVVFRQCHLTSRLGMSKLLQLGWEISRERGLLCYIAGCVTC